MKDVSVTFRKLDERLWVAEHSLKIAGIDFGRRMTVVLLSSGELWLHSVAHLTPELREQLDAIGPVRFVVSPNRFHHKYMEHYRAVYPEAELLASPGLPERREDLSFSGILGDKPDPRWVTDLDQTAFHGNKISTEIVFLHHASRTLILTDLCFNLPPSRPFFTRLAARALGVYNRLAVSLTMRRGMSDHNAARESLERILQWDFDRVIVGHGDIVETEGRENLERAFAWME
jgi:hypothetical protein